MSKNIFRSVSLFALLGIVLAACAPAATTAPAATSAPAATAAPAATKAPEATKATDANAAPVTIKIFSPQDPNGDLATNSFTLEAQKKFNIKFEFQTTTFDGNAAKEKRQISLASGDYPDLYMLIPWVDQFSETDLLRYGAQGVLIPLNDLIDQYAPNIKAALAKYPYFKAEAYAPDGKIYGLPQYVDCYHCSYPNKLWVNTSWLKKLNILPPKTTEEFKAMLMAFKTKDPNGDGKADEVPLSGSTEDYGVHVIPYLMNAFIYDDDRTYLIMKDGKADMAATKPEWKDGLGYIKSLVDAGLVDPGSFTQNAEAFKKIGDNASAEILGAGAGMHPAIFVTTGDNAKTGSHYDVLPPLVGPNSVHYATYNFGSSAGATFVLTNKASKEAQIAAIKLVDYMFTVDGQIRAHFGEEGKDWRKPKAGDIAVDDKSTPSLAQIPLGKDEKPHNSAWGALAQYFQPKEFRDSWVQATDVYASAGYERRLQVATTLYDGNAPKELYPHWAVWIDPNSADEAATLRQNITDYVNQNSLQFVTGSKDLTKDWDAYIAGFDKLNLKRYLEIMQKAYDNSFKK